MITQAESGLTQEQYDALKLANVKPSLQVMVQRYSPQFERYDHSTTFLDTTLYNTCVSQWGLFRAIDGKIWKSTDFGVTWTDTGVTYDNTYLCTPSLTYDGSSVLLLYRSNLSLIAKATTNGTSWTQSTWVNGTMPDSVYMISAPNHTRAYCLYRNGTYNWNTAIFLAHPTGSVTLGNIWGHQATGFVAMEKGTEEDVLVISTNLPPLVGMRPAGAQVQMVSFRASGLVSFIVKEKRVSDHYNIETFDDTNIWLRRLYVRGSKINGCFYVTAYGSDGTSAHQTDSIQIYKSKDGKYWEQALPVIAPELRRGAGIGIDGDYIYLVGNRTVYRALKTAWFGSTAASLIQDITYLIEAYSHSAGQVGQTNLTLQNVNNEVFVDTILKYEGVYQFLYYLGYIVNGTPLRILYSTEELDFRKKPRELPVNSVNLITRDHMSWLTEKVTAHHVVERETGVIGPDDFIDDTTTGYGGLRHTSVQTGSFRTDEKQLLVSGHNARAVAFSSFDTDAWNGSIEFDFYVPTPQGSVPDDMQCYAEAIFRAYDKDNYYFIRARKDYKGNLLEIGQYAGGEEVILATSTTLVINYDTWYRIKAVTYYQIVNAMWRNPSVVAGNWTNITWSYIKNNASVSNIDYFIKPGEGTEPQTYQPNRQFTAVVERGFFGYGGWGYSNIDNWNDWGASEVPELAPILPPVDLPDPENLDCAEYDWSQVDPGDGPKKCLDAGYPFGTVLVIENNNLLITYSFSSSSPEWIVVTKSSDHAGATLMDFDIDPYSPAVQGTGSAIGVYLLTSGAIKYCSDVTVETPSWSTVQVTQFEHQIIRAIDGNRGGAVAYAQNVSTSTTVSKTADLSGWSGSVYEGDGFTLRVVGGGANNGDIQLATGEGNYIEIEFDEPSWIDEDFTFEAYLPTFNFGHTNTKMMYFYDNGTILGNYNTADGNGGEAGDAPMIGHQWANASGWQARMVNPAIEKPSASLGYYRTLRFWIDESPNYIIRNLTMEFKTKTNGAAQVTYVNRISSTVSEKTFGFPDNESMGMDVDQQNLGMIYAVANGHIYNNAVSGAFAYTNGFTEVVTSESFVAYRIACIRLFEKQFNGLQNILPNVHGALFYNILPPDEELTAWTNSVGRWTEYNFQNRGSSGWYPEPGLDYGQLSGIDDGSFLNIIAAGPHAVDSFMDNPRLLIYTGYRSGQQDQLPATRNYCQVAITVDQNITGESSYYSYSWSIIGTKKLDMIMHSPRNKNNLYGCGKDGVWYSSNRGQGTDTQSPLNDRVSWENKTGNINAMLGTIPALKRVKPVIMRIF